MDEHVWARLAASAEQAVARFRSKSVLQSCGLLLGITVPTGAYGTVATLSINGAVQFAFVLLMSVPVLFYMGVYAYFMMKDPSKLRSEDYELRKTALDMIQEKGGPVHIADASVQAIVNIDTSAPKSLPKEKRNG